MKNQMSVKENFQRSSLCGRIVKSTGGLYSVRQDDGTTIQCRAKGSFRHERITPLAGDEVLFEMQDDGNGFITEIKQRKNFLIRPAVSNVDLLVIVVACAEPDPDSFVIDKLSAVAEANGIDLLFIFNKSDIKSGQELQDVYSRAGYKTFVTSIGKLNEDNELVKRIKQELQGKICFFSGASGVGKSSVINALFPHLELETGQISKKIQRGKHTTRCTELHYMDNGTYIGDTPGFSMLDVVGFKLLEPEKLLSSFPDIEKFADGCKYKGCTHICEDGCNVVKAVEDGLISKSRHDSFVLLYNELKAVKPWECLGR